MAIVSDCGPWLTGVLYGELGSISVAAAVSVDNFTLLLRIKVRELLASADDDDGVLVVAPVSAADGRQEEKEALFSSFIVISLT